MSHPHHPPPRYPGPAPYGWSAPPPRKRRTGLWAGLAAVVVLIGALLVTGFLAPGFLLGQDGARPAAPTTSATPGATRDPNDSARKFLTALNGGDRGTAEGMFCPHSTPGPQLEQALGGNTRLRLAKPVDADAPYSVFGELTGTVNGKRPSTAVLVLVDNGAPEWCVSSLVLGP